MILANAQICNVRYYLFHRFQVFPDLIPHNDAVGVGNVAKKRIKRTQQEHILCTEGSMDLTYEGLGWVRHTATLETFCQNLYQGITCWLTNLRNDDSFGIKLIMSRDVPSTFVFDKNASSLLDESWGIPRWIVEYVESFLPRWILSYCCGSRSITSAAHHCRMQLSGIFCAGERGCKGGGRAKPPSEKQSWGSFLSWLPLQMVNLFFESILWIHDLLVCTPNLWVHSSLSGLQYIPKSLGIPNHARDNQKKTLFSGWGHSGFRRYQTSLAGA